MYEIWIYKNGQWRWWDTWLEEQRQQMDEDIAWLQSRGRKPFVYRTTNFYGA